MTDVEGLDFNINISPDQNAGTNSNSAQTKQQVTEKTIKSSKKAQKQKVSSNVKIDFTNFLSHANHPGIVFFTLFFKALAIVAFLFFGIFGMPDSLLFIFVVILNSLDFWFVKNISGRILVGLRWWNEVKEDGSEEWKFESSQEVKSKSIDTTVFWMSLYIAPAFWGVFLILELIGLKLMWFLVCLIGFILTFSNTFGYYKCSKDQNKKISGFFKDQTTKGFSKIMEFGVNTFGNNN